MTAHGGIVATVAQAQAAVGDRLRAAGVPTPDVDARLLVAHVLGWTPAQVTVRGLEPLPDAAAERMDSLVRRRERREPLQRIIGHVGFRFLDIAVCPQVFIPRPETELLAGEAVAHTPPHGVVVEPCTGSGAVACAVASEASPCTVVATDNTAAAVACARANARRAGVDVLVLLGDLLAPVAPILLGRVDVLVSNPPYLAAHELDGLEPEVARWDPAEALVAGPTGDEVVGRLVAEAGSWLRPGGWLLLELAEARVRQTVRRCRDVGMTHIGVLNDFTGRERILVARTTVV